MSDDRKADNPDNQGDAPAPGSDEYNQQMADKARNQGAGKVADDDPKPNELPVPEMPEGGHEKFYDKKTGAYNWEGHAKEVEYNQQRRADTNEPEPTPEETQTAEAEQEAYSSLMSDLAAGGEASEETVKKFRALGMTPGMTSRAIADATFRIKEEQSKAFEHVGGEQAMGELLQWAKDNLSQEEIDYYNQGLSGGAWRRALDDLQSHRANGKPTAREGQLTDTGNSVGAGTGVEGYTSRRQMLDDMQDPRYAKDPSFRALVAQRRSKATFDNDVGFDQPRA